VSDTTIQAAIQTLIQAHASFANADVTLGDTRVLNTGTPPVVIIYPGRCRVSRPGDWAQVTYIWTHSVVLWDRHVPDSYSSIGDTRQSVLDHLNAYPTLNGTSGVSRSTASAGSGPTFLWRKGQPRDAQPQFVGLHVEVETVEEVNYDRNGEFA